MKVAIATEDGAHVSAHFGRAPFFEVLTLENGKIVGRERRAKAFHQGNHTHAHHDEGGRDTHASGMVAVVLDCAAIIAGGMGQPAFASIEASGLKAILTDERDIDRAAEAYANGSLVNHTERLH